MATKIEFKNSDRIYNVRLHSARLKYFAFDFRRQHLTTIPNNGHLCYTGCVGNKHDVQDRQMWLIVNERIRYRFAEAVRLTVSARGTEMPK